MSNLRDTTFVHFKALKHCLLAFYTFCIEIFHKSVEYNFPCLDQGGQSPVLLIGESVLDAKAREQQKALEYGEQTVHAITLAYGRKCISLCHLDLSENRTYGLHCCCHIRFLKKSL